MGHGLPCGGRARPAQARPPALGGAADGQRGMSERVAMSLTGHKTPSLFDRYHIVSRADRRAAVALLNSLNADKHGDNRRRRLETLRASG